MSDLIARTARLVPYAKRPKASASFVTAYVYEPEADEAGSSLGNLYVAVEVLISGRASEEVVDLVIQTVGDKYYNEQPDENDALARFEAAIKQTNHELSEYVGRGNAAWIGKLSAVLAVQCAGELHVAQTGSAEAFLYRGKAVSRITQTDTAKPSTPSKTFGSIATGDLQAGDKFLLATPALIHQVPLEKLQTIVASTSPNTAIAEISQLLSGANTSRIAAIVVEVTTPELAALKVRSDEPAEIELAGGETFAEAAINAAAPIAKTSAGSALAGARAALGTAKRLQPKLQSAGLRFAALLRHGLSTKSGRRLALALLIALIFVMGLAVWRANSGAASTKQFNSYQSLFAGYTKATAAAASGDKAGARQQLTSIQTALSKLGQNEAGINSALKNNPLLEGEPTSVAGFKTLIAGQLDLLEGLVTVTPLTVAEVGGKNGRPTHFESDGAHAYVIDAADHNQISIINLSTGDQRDSKADARSLGDVINTTLSATGDGMFILTAKPSVWFYKFSSDSLSQQNLAYGDWPKSHALASYASNLYLLGDTTIYKQVRNSNGYSPKTDYISTTSSSNTGPNTGLAVDGWVYVLNASGLHRYLGTSLKQSATAPQALGALTNLRSQANGGLLVATSQSSGRIAVWSATNDKLTFDKQMALSDGKKLYDAAYDQNTGRIFATVDNRLVSFSFKR